MAETETAPNPTDAAVEAPATLLATATSETSTTQQTQSAETPAAAAAETTAASTTQQEAAKTTNAPETYTFTAPEGKAYDSTLLDAFSGAAKEADLTQDAAQKLIEKMAPAIAERQLDQVKAIHAEWTATSTADKEFGGEKLAENLGVARKALDAFGTPELRTLLDTTGMGNHPEVIRLLFRAGKAISEDGFVAGAPRAAAAVRPADILYDKAPPKG